MDAASAAATFASVVGLLADFASQRRHSANLEYEDFLAWLAETRHSELVELLHQNATTATSIKALLNQDRRVLLDKIERLDRSLASIASAIEGFAQLAAAVYPGSELSRQALRILREFHSSGAGKALDVKTFDGRCLLLFDGGGGEIQFDEVRFVDDDLSTLVEAGLLRLDYNSTGQRMYIFTRAAADYLCSLSGGV